MGGGGVGSAGQILLARGHPAALLHTGTEDGDGWVADVVRRAPVRSLANGVDGGCWSEPRVGGFY